MRDSYSQILHRFGIISPSLRLCKEGDFLMIEVNNLSKKYDSSYAVNDLSFIIEKGKIYGLLGANGAGKSTTMNMLTGYLAPSSGTILIDGIDILKNPIKAKEKIGYLPEIPPLYTDMTVYEYLKFVSELKHVKRVKIKEEIENVAKKVGLSPVLDSLIKKLSKGYKQRVGLAQALIGNPEIIILDEPTVGLDPAQIVEIRNLIEGLRDEHTVILSSHILSEIESVCDQIIIISKGHLVAMDSPQNLSKKSQGKNIVEVEIKGNKTAVGNMLNTIPSVEKIEFREDGSILVESVDDIREDIFYQCVKENMPILMLKSDMASLEDVFLELTSDDGLASSDDTSDSEYLNDTDNENKEEE